MTAGCLASYPVFLSVPRRPMSFFCGGVVNACMVDEMEAVESAEDDWLYAGQNPMAGGISCGFVDMGGSAHCCSTLQGESLDHFSSWQLF